MGQVSALVKQRWPKLLASSERLEHATPFSAARRNLSGSQQWHPRQPMARIPDAFIDDLLARTDIVEVIGARVPLKRQGKEYSARCPFHDERSPSFTVSPTKQFYHCFGCGAHGTAISFLMNYDRLEFLDAVEELAKRVGMEVPRDTQQRNANPDTQRPVRRARRRREVLPQATRRQRQGAGLLRQPRRRRRRSRERFAHRLRARRLQRAARCARHRPAPHAAARTRRHVLEERQAATSTTSSATG